MEQKAVYLGLLFLIVYSGTVQVNRESYDDSVKLIRTMVNNGSYDPRVRPRFNQSEIVTVNFSFNLFSVDVDEVAQSVSVSGLLMLFWKDQFLTWDPADYSGATQIFPHFSEIWKPQIIIVNTLGTPKLREEDQYSVNVSNEGLVTWSRADIFSVSCVINPTVYPYDEQACGILLGESNYNGDQVLFHAFYDDLNTGLFVTNSEWQLTGFRMIGDNAKPSSASNGIPIIMITFKLKRRPSYPIITVVLPVILLSYLNTMVFVIPAESGEKVGYGITVLLAQAVYLSEMNNLLPKNSIKVPFLSLYILSLFIMSVITVGISIIVVCLNHLGKEQTSTNEEEVNPGSSQTSLVCQRQKQVNWKVVSNRINKASFVLSTLIWLVITVAFFQITV